MVLANGGSEPRTSNSIYSRTLPRNPPSRPAGDAIVNIENADPSVRKMDTVVKLEAVSLCLCTVTYNLKDFAVRAQYID